jgi:TrmH family RNA methyltransferase
VLTDGTADASGPKAVRASAGAVLRLPIEESALLTAVVRLVDAGLHVVVADATGAVPLDAADLRGDVAVVLGNESHGVPDDLLRADVERVRIPMAAGTESLNVAMAGSVLLFEAARQRRMGSARD